MPTNTEIKLCGTCDGAGHTSHSELVNYHKRDYATIKKKCTFCGGSGRLLVTTVTTIEPYVEKEES